mmetsp:Transcript_14795/g.14894  ORF Transcript_14795/g.14894 Transcript_14795/m.14894 type:complete len:248 (+) Transcript_14795:100-843(+)
MESKKKSEASTPIIYRTPLTDGPILMSTDGTFIKTTQNVAPEVIPPSSPNRNTMLQSSPSDEILTDNLIKRGLFGGAITIMLPSSFQDVSVIRQVPDNQEVYVDSLSDMSVIIELLEHEPTVSNEHCARYFFQELAAFNQAADIVVEKEQVMRADSDLIPSLPPAYPRCTLVGRQTVKKFSRDSLSPSPPDEIRIYLVVLRLIAVGTDLLLSLNAPLAQSSSSSLSAEDLVRATVNSLEIHNWSLFA